MAIENPFTMIDDKWFQHTLEQALGDQYQTFDNIGESDPLHDLDVYESILYSLGKQDLILIIEIIQAFSTTPSPRLALHALVKKLTDVLGVSHCSLILLNLEKKTGTVAISHEDPDFEGVRISLDSYPEILRSLRTGEITLVKNPTQDPLMHSLKKDQIRKIKDVSIMVLPLIYQGKVFGTLLVRKHRSKDGFILREVRICQLMVHTVIRSLQRMCKANLSEAKEKNDTLRTSTVSTEEGEPNAASQSMLFSSIPIGIFLIDAQGAIVQANLRASEITGIPQPQLLAMKFSEIVPHERIDEIRRMRKSSSPTDHDLNRYHVPYQPPQGETRTLSVEQHVFPVNTSFTWVFFRDVSIEKQLEEHLQKRTQELTETNQSLQETRVSLLNRNQELHKTNERLEELNKMKTHFLAVATHEIRTPLSVVIGYNQFLLQEKAGKVQSAQKNILEESVQSCERLLNIVNEMLDFSRIETGNLELHLKENDILVLLERVYRQMKIISDRATIDLHLQIPKEPVVFAFDPDRVEQVLVNLISNSIKFTSPGGTVILTAQIKVEKQDTVIELSVSDTGKGLSPDMVNRIFQDDHPLVSNDFASSHAKGMGLGLAISRRIVEAHGGRIWGEGKEGKGATFTFDLPFLMLQKKETDTGIRSYEQKAPPGY